MRRRCEHGLKAYQCYVCESGDPPQEPSLTDQIRHVLGPWNVDSQPVVVLVQQLVSRLAEAENRESAPVPDALIAARTKI
jgi:hypothetical protein